MIRRFGMTAFVLGFFLACASTASAANPSLAQTPVCTASLATASFAAAPANVDYFAALSATWGSNPGSLTVSDSNSVQYPQIYAVNLGGTTGTYGYGWTNAVVGSPTSTVTFNAGFTAICIYDIANVGAPTFQTSTNSARNTSVTFTGTLAGDLIVCGGAIPANSVALSNTNGTLVTDGTTGGAYAFGHFTAIATATTTITLATPGAGGNAVLGCMDYSPPIPNPLIGRFWPWLGPILAQ